MFSHFSELCSIGNSRILHFILSDSERQRYWTQIQADSTKVHTTLLEQHLKKHLASAVC